MQRRTLLILGVVLLAGCLTEPPRPSAPSTSIDYARLAARGCVAVEGPPVPRGGPHYAEVEIKPLGSGLLNLGPGENGSIALEVRVCAQDPPARLTLDFQITWSHWGSPEPPRPHWPILAHPSALSFKENNTTRAVELGLEVPAESPVGRWSIMPLLPDWNGTRSVHGATLNVRSSAS